MQEATYKKLLKGVLVATIGVLVTLTSDTLIRMYFPDRLILSDFLFTIIPNVPILSYLADGIITFSFLLVGFVLSERKLNRIAEFAFSIGIMMTLRGLLNFVTPLGDPSGDHEIYGFLERKPLLGMFPSGHIASLNLQYWLIRHWKAGKYWQWLFIVFIVLESIALLSTRGHYSIDIAGGILLGYVAVKVTKNYL